MSPGSGRFPSDKNSSSQSAARKSRSSTRNTRAKLSRSVSHSSAASTVHENTDAETETYTMAELITMGKCYVTRAENSIAAKKLPTEKTLKNLRYVFEFLQNTEEALQSRIRQLEINEASLQTSCQHLQESLDHARQTNEKLIERIPDTVTLIEAVRSTLKQNQADQAAAIESTTISPTETATPPVPQTYSQTAAQPAKKFVLESSNRKTLIIKGTSITPGKEIEIMLSKEAIATPIHVDKVAPRRNHVEVTCKTEEDLKRLQAELQHNQVLNKKLNFLQKAVPKHKMILLGVPEALTKEALTIILGKTYHITEEDIIVLKELPNRHNEATKDLILLLPKSLGIELINDGGIVIGLKTCRLRPHTTILRCRRCQGLTHHERNCKAATPVCACCGEAHHEESCAAAPRCINCTKHNTQHNTHFPTSHKASDSGCSTYRSKYSSERERLNLLFQIGNSSQVHLTPEEPNRHQQFNTQHPPIQEATPANSPYHHDEWYGNRSYRNEYHPPYQGGHNGHHHDWQGRPFY